jgi:hypothetical protein
MFLVHFLCRLLHPPGRKIEPGPSDSRANALTSRPKLCCLSSTFMQTQSAFVSQSIKNTAKILSFDSDLNHCHLYELYFNLGPTSGTLGFAIICAIQLTSTSVGALSVQRRHVVPFPWERGSIKETMKRIVNLVSTWAPCPEGRHGKSISRSWG